MKKICFALLSATCLINNINAQIAPVVPSSSSIADASVAVENDWSSFRNTASLAYICLLYTSDAADELDGVDLGGRRIIKKIFFFQE
jgi:hypothetical protein